MTRQQEINSLLNTLGVKKSFLAQKLGISKQVLSYQLNIAGELDYEYYVKINEILETIRKELGHTGETYIAGGHNRTYSHPDSENSARALPRYRIEATVPAGIGEMNSYDDWFESDVLDYNPADHFFIRVDSEFGYSMMPLIAPGDLVLVSCSAKLKNGDMVAALWDGTKGAIKIYQEAPRNHTQVFLLSYNQAVPIITVEKQSAKFYKVVLLKKQN